MTLHEAIVYGEELLGKAGVAEPRWNAERVLLLALQQDRSKIYSDLRRELTPMESERFRWYLGNRSEHYPLAYMEGSQEFFGRQFAVNEDVLIPRPETEEIIREVLSLALSGAPRIIDLGSGSGNIPITLALEFPRAFVVACEISHPAIRVLRRNSAGRVRIVCADLYAPPFVPGPFDVVTCNPPYVEQSDFEHLPAETRWEPGVALTTTRTLEAVYNDLLASARHLLRPGGWLVFEIGWGQLDRVQAMCEKHPMRLQNVRNDSQGIPRTITLQNA